MWPWIDCMDFQMVSNCNALIKENLQSLSKIESTICVINFLIKCFNDIKVFCKQIKNI